MKVKSHFHHGTCSNALEVIIKWKQRWRGLKWTLGEGFSNFPPKSIWSSRSIGVWALDSVDLCLRNLSKIARRRNIEMRMAVATMPKDTALTESSKCFQCSCLWVFNGATIGGVASTPIIGYLFVALPFSLVITKSRQTEKPSYF